MTEPIDPNPSDWYLQPVYQAPVPVEPPPDHRPVWRRVRWTVPTILISALVLAAVGAGLFFLVYEPDHPDPLPIPLAFDGYTRISSPNTERLESLVRTMPGGASATVGFYSRNTGDAPRLIVFVFPDEVFPGGVEQVADSVQDDIGASGAELTSYPAGPRGGGSRCGSVDFAAVPAQMCAWADDTSAGALISVVTPMTAARLAQIEQDFRDRLPR